MGIIAKYFEPVVSRLIADYRGEEPPLTDREIIDSRLEALEEVALGGDPLSTQALADFAAMQSDFIAMQSDFATINASIQGVDNRLTTEENNVDALQTSDATQQTLITLLQSDIFNIENGSSTMIPVSISALPDSVQLGSSTTIRRWNQVLAAGRYFLVYKSSYDDSYMTKQLMVDSTVGEWVEVDRNLRPEFELGAGSVATRPYILNQKLEIFEYARDVGTIQIIALYKY